MIDAGTYGMSVGICSDRTYEGRVYGLFKGTFGTDR